MKKTGRNDPCPCGSAKKFKKCCESKMIGGRFMATKVSPASSPQVTSASRLTGFFQSHVSTVKPSGEFRSIRASAGAVQKTEVEMVEQPSSEVQFEEVVEQKDGI